MTETMNAMLALAPYVLDCLTTRGTTTDEAVDALHDYIAREWHTLDRAAMTTLLRRLILALPHHAQRIDALLNDYAFADN